MSMASSATIFLRTVGRCSSVHTAATTAAAAAAAATFLFLLVGSGCLTYGGQVRSLDLSACRRRAPREAVFPPESRSAGDMTEFHAEATRRFLGSRVGWSPPPPMLHRPWNWRWRVLYPPPPPSVSGGIGGGCPPTYMVEEGTGDCTPHPPPPPPLQPPTSPPPPPQQSPLP